MKRILAVAGVSKDRSLEIMEELKEVGFVNKKGKSLHFPHGEKHFEAFGESAIKKQKYPQEVLMDIFLHWQEEHKKKHQKLTDKRKKKIVERLNDGYTMESIKQAITGCLYSPFHMGENEHHRLYNDLFTILCTADRVDRHIDAFVQERRRLERQSRREEQARSSNSRKSEIEQFRKKSDDIDF